MLGRVLFLVVDAENVAAVFVGLDRVYKHCIVFNSCIEVCTK